ncbi:hypothetical protein DFH28DRAFT_896261 [Melampsora americana]|nr:hypothetical protein DFH28DRAFT_896261 [Melampsora americana]
MNEIENEDEKEIKEIQIDKDQIQEIQKEEEAEEERRELRGLNQSELNQSEENQIDSRNRTRTRTRTRTESDFNSLRIERNWLHDELPARSQTAIAYSSQQILATALKPDPDSSNQTSLNLIRIGFSILPLNKRKTPSWYFTLPSPSIPPYKHRPSYRKSFQPLVRSEVDLLLFSHDGMYLLVCSHTSSTFYGLGHLRISVLIQAHDRVDKWELGFDEVICDWSVRGVLDNEPLEPHIKRVLKARFLGEPRKWSIESVNEGSDQDSVLVGPRNVRLSKPKKTCGSLIDNATQGKAPTVIMVLNTNELFVIHLPFRQSNLPAHVLLAPLGNSTLASGPLNLIPTPGSNRSDRRRTITNDSERNSPEEPILKANPKPNLPKNVGLGLMLESEPFPMHHHQFNSSHFPSLEPPVQSRFTNTSFSEIRLLMNEKVNLERSIDLNPNEFNPFDSMIHDFRSNRKELNLASIGFPLMSTSTLAAEEGGSGSDEMNSVILIGFQSRTKPIIPTPVKQIILPSERMEKEVNLQANSLNEEVEDEIGDYITGLGELDEAFIEDEKKMKPRNANEGLGLGLGMDMGLGMGLGLGMEMERSEEIETQERRMKSKIEGIQTVKVKNRKRKRYEPLYGIDESEDLAGAGNQTRFGLIEFVEVFLDFDHGMIPTISIKPLPSIPILDPSESNEGIKIKLKSLEFLESNHLSTSTDLKPELSLIVGYSREEFDSKDRLETWKIRFCRSELSNGFLGLECFGNNSSSGVGNSENHKIEIDPETTLRGPEEWVSFVLLIHIYFFLNEIGQRKKIELGLFFGKSYMKTKLKTSVL